MFSFIRTSSSYHHGRKRIIQSFKLSSSSLLLLIICITPIIIIFAVEFTESLQSMKAITTIRCCSKLRFNDDCINTPISQCHKIQSSSSMLLKLAPKKTSSRKKYRYQFKTSSSIISRLLNDDNNIEEEIIIEGNNYISTTEERTNLSSDEPSTFQIFDDNQYDDGLSSLTTDDTTSTSQQQIIIDNRKVIMYSKQNLSPSFAPTASSTTNHLVKQINEEDMQQRDDDNGKQMYPDPIIQLEEGITNQHEIIQNANELASTNDDQPSLSLQYPPGPPSKTESSLDNINHQSKSKSKTIILTSKEFFRIFHIAYHIDTNKSIFVSMIAGLTGFTDILYFARYRCYVNMMTGNTLKAIKGMNYKQYGTAVFHIVLCIAYVCGAVWTNLKKDQLHNDIKNKHKQQQEQEMSMSKYNQTITSSSSTQLLMAPSGIEHSSTKLSTITNNGRRSEPVYPIAFYVAKSTLLLFISADTIALFTSHNQCYCRFSAVPIALAYGILNTCTTELTGGTILYALTGHFTKIGKAITELYELLLIIPPTVTTTNVIPNKKGQRNNNIIVDEDKIIDIFRLLSYHFKVIFGFTCGVVAALRIFVNVPSLLTLSPNGIDTFCSQATTKSLWDYIPINTIIGTVYATMLYWYGQNGNTNQSPTK